MKYIVEQFFAEQFFRKTPAPYSVEALCENRLAGNYFCKKTSTWMFAWVMNSPLNTS